MKKLFVSQPMNGKSADQIKDEMDRVLAEAKSSSFGEDIVLIDSFFGNADKSNPLFCIAESLKKMGEADIVWFVSGWKEARGCVVEHQVALSYLPSAFIVEEEENGWRNVTRSSEWCCLFNVKSEK